MGLEALLVFLLIGAVAGWLAGLVMAGGGFGLIGNIVVGILGALIAGWLLPRLGVSINVGGPIVNQIIHAFLGAIVLLFIVGIIRR